MQYFYVLILDHETLLNLFVGSISCLEDFLEFCAKKDNFPSSVLILIPTFFFFLIYFLWVGILVQSLMQVARITNVTLFLLSVVELQL
jgi:hypothetical protein